MKKIVYLLIPGTLMIFSCHNKKACDVYISNLKLIKEGVTRDPGTNLSKVSLAISFFEKTTGMISESPPTYIGRMEPSQRDYERWKEWFKQNHSSLY